MEESRLHSWERLSATQSLRLDMELCSVSASGKRKGPEYTDKGREEATEPGVLRDANWRAREVAILMLFHQL